MRGGSLTYEFVAIGNATIADVGYTLLKIFSDTLLFATVHGWTNNTGAFSIVIASERYIYLVGTPGVTVTNLSIKAWKWQS